MALSIGQTVGEYKIIGIIGSGGMGTVYKVQHVISDRVEAMKVILPDLARSSELADRFIREIRVQARLNDPNIASLYNAFPFENQLFMVVEYVDGTTLSSVLREGKMQLDKSIEVAVQVLKALDYAHKEGVVHRDIKPANIMLTSKGAVKLMDFGIARSSNDQQLTQTGATLGSIYYMSPEQVRGASVDHRSDLYSVGIVLYEMVTGIRPITGESSWEVMNAHVNSIPLSPSALNSNLPGYLCSAILKALEKDPESRHQSASAFTAALKLSSNLPTSAGLTDSKRFNSTDLDRVKRDLAMYIGPMARIVVDRAAKKAASWQQLYETLSSEIDAPKERAKFLATRPR